MGQKFFCYIAVNNKKEFITEWVIMAVSICLLIRTLLQYKVVREVSRSRYVKRIYYLLFSWNAVFLVRLLSSEFLYLHFVDDDNDRQLSRYCRHYFVIDITTAFLLQWILVLIPYNWVSNVISIFKQMQTMDEDDIDNDESELAFEKNTQKLLKFYMMCRLLIYAVIIIAFFFVDNYDAWNYISKILLGLLLGEALFVTIILGLGIRALKKNQKLLQLIEQSEVRVMINQYSILIICTIIRFIADSYVVIRRFTIYSPQSCKITQEFNLQYLALLILQVICTHFLPIIIVQRIYCINKADYDLTKSLLAANKYEVSNMGSSSEEGSPKKRSNSKF